MFGEPREACIEIGLQVVEILKPDMQTKRRSLGLPVCRACDRPRVEGRIRLSKPPQE